MSAKYPRKGPYIGNRNPLITKTCAACGAFLAGAQIIQAAPRQAVSVPCCLKCSKGKTADELLAAKDALTPSAPAPDVPARINDTATRELFRAYITGWRDRAVGRARRRDNFAHRPDLLEEYDRGEEAGAKAAGEAAAAAAARLGYDLEHSVIDR
jgi:hypothetical protein